MRVIETESTNFVFKRPEGLTEEECGDLPCRVTENGIVTSVWEFTPEERAAIASGANLRIHVWACPTPPVAADLTTEQEVVK